MRRTLKWFTGPMVLLLVGLGCSDDTNPGQDSGIIADKGTTQKERGGADKGPAQDTKKATHLKVAAVQYSSGDYTSAKGCSDDLCGMGHFIKQAAIAGASIVVTPEYSQDQKVAEAAPKVGDRPCTSATWSKGSITKTLSQLADDQNITLVFNLITQEGAGTGAKLYNTSVAVDKDCKVLAYHYKFELFSKESLTLTPGPSVATSFFNTPAGKAGLMICADAQCIVTGFVAGPSCTAHSVSMLKDFFINKQPKIVLFSAFWTIGSGTWGSMNVQKLISQVSTSSSKGVWVVGANNTYGSGRGGGIWSPGGTAVKTVVQSTPSVVYADIPIP